MDTDTNAEENQSNLFINNTYALHIWLSPLH